MIGVGGDVGDELLRREGEEAGEGEGGGGGGEPGEEEVVLRYCVGDLGGWVSFFFFFYLGLFPLERKPWRGEWAETHNGCIVVHFAQEIP